jgi:hypothetical protein
MKRVPVAGKLLVGGRACKTGVLVLNLRQAQAMLKVWQRLGSPC